MNPRRACVLVVPGALSTRSGGYEYDRRIVEALRWLGWSVDVIELGGSFPHPAAGSLSQAAIALAGIPTDSLVVIDGLALGAMPQQTAHESGRLRIVALVHMPLSADVGLDAATAAALAVSETRALASVLGVIATGRSTVAALGELGVPADRIVVVEPGTTRAPIARGSGGPALHLLSVAAITPGKGHEVLVRALARIPGQLWRLTCAGSVERDRATVERVRALVRQCGLEERVSLVGELDDDGVARMYDETDVFVLATLRETYGMAVAEALGRGLPIVSTRTGAIPDLVGTGDDAAGLIVSPDNVDELSRALSDVIGDSSLRQRLTVNARRVRDRLPTWDDAGRQFSVVLAGCVNEGSHS